MRLGIGSYTYGWDSGVYGTRLSEGRKRLTARDLVDRAVAFDVQVVQIVNLPALEGCGDRELEDLAAYGEEVGIEFEVGTVGSDPGLIRKWMRVARFLNARVIRTLFPQASPSLAAERRTLKELAPELRESGVKLAIENHEAHSTDDLVSLLGELEDCAGACVDSVNSLGRGEGVREVVQSLMPHAISLHVKDFKSVRGSTDMGFTITGASTGEGQLDIDWLLQEAASSNPDMSVILEQWTPIVGDLESAIAMQERWAEAGVTYLRERMA